MGLLEKAVGVARAVVSSSDEVGLLSRENKDLKRRNAEYFDVIEKMQMQRDEWKQMYFTQSAQHQVAQEMLQRRARIVGEQLAKAVRHLNQFLEEGGHEPLQSPKSLEALSDDVAARYGQRMKKLAAGVGEDIDGEAERQRIAGGQ